MRNWFFFAALLSVSSLAWAAPLRLPINRVECGPRIAVEGKTSRTTLAPQLVAYQGVILRLNPNGKIEQAQVENNGVGEFSSVPFAYSRGEKPSHLLVGGRRIAYAVFSSKFRLHWFLPGVPDRKEPIEIGSELYLRRYPIRAAAFAPLSLQLFTVEDSGMISKWNATSGLKERVVYDEKEKSIRWDFLAASGAGEAVIAATKDGKIIWEAASVIDTILRKDIKEEIKSIAISENGMYGIALTTSGKLHWLSVDGKITPFMTEIQSASFVGTESRHVLIQSGGKALIWNQATKEIDFTLETDGIEFVSFTQTKGLILGQSQDGQVYFWRSP